MVDIALHKRTKLYEITVRKVCFSNLALQINYVHGVHYILLIIFQNEKLFIKSKF